ETAILGVGYVSDKCCILFNIPFIMELEGEIEEAQIVYEGVKDFYNNFAELKSYHEKSLKIINVLENKSLQEVERLKKGDAQEVARKDGRKQGSELRPLKRSEDICVYDRTSRPVTRAQMLLGVRALRPS
ncbi:hypothetical protein J6590_098393, partial [Homalodisca vitripennis]